ncbi:GNAT family N-acetyltransferase [soil metagenome]
MTTVIKRTDSTNPDFISLVRQLDAELRDRFGEAQTFFDQFNKLDSIKHVVVTYYDEVPVGCGAIKKFDESTMEVKRMFVHPLHRGKGYAAEVLSELEKWTAEMNFSHCVLETGDKLPEAVGLYEKSGYSLIPRYGQYANSESSICMKKRVT